MEIDENHGKIIEIIDKRMGENYDMKSTICVAKLAMRCVHAQPTYRPSVTDLVGELREIAKHDNEASKVIIV